MCFGENKNMMFNIREYIKKTSFIIITVLYISFFTIGRVKDYNKLGVDINYYLFSPSFALYINGDYSKVYIMTHIITKSLPTLIYYLYIFITYYHYSFSMDSTFIFLRISRKKKLFKYYLESFSLFSIVYLTLIITQLLFINYRYEVLFNWTIILVHIVNSLIFYLFFISFMSILQILTNDHEATIFTFLLLVIFSFGNYFLYFSKLIVDENYNIFNEYFPTYFNILYYHNFYYSLFYIASIMILLVINLKLILKKDLNKEVVK